MARVMYRGKVVDERTANQLREVERLVTSGPLIVSQGSYSTSVGQSAGTHAGGGAVDLTVWHLSDAQRRELVEAMRRVGFAFWIRQPDEGDWPVHGHGVSIGCPDLSPSARGQVEDYKAGLNGLATEKRDPHAALGIRPTTWEKYMESKKPPTRPAPVPNPNPKLTPLVIDIDAEVRREHAHGVYSEPIRLALRLLGFEPDGDGARQLQKALGYTGESVDGTLGESQLRWLADRFGLRVK